MQPARLERGLAARNPARQPSSQLGKRTAIQPGAQTGSHPGSHSCRQLYIQQGKRPGNQTARLSRRIQISMSQAYNTAGTQEHRQHNRKLDMHPSILPGWEATSQPSNHVALQEAKLEASIILARQPNNKKSSHTGRYTSIKPANQIADCHEGKKAASHLASQLASKPGCQTDREFYC